MLRAREQLGITSRGVLALAGLLLMMASLIWLQLFPASKEPALSTKSHPPGEVVSLVIIDPGHGGIDSGTISGGILEKDLALDVAQRVRRLVHLQGFETLLTRESDDYKSLANRADFANRQRDCIFVSIHFDEAQRAASTGVETYYAAHQFERAFPFSSWLPFLQHTSAESPDILSQSLAGFIQESLVKRTQAFDRGTRAAQFFVIANVRHPAVLVEGGFLTNKDDVAKLASEDYRERMAAAICEGILQYRDTLRGRQPALAVANPES
jgi:N-acetylmuramoyl-L-alanine amidase